MVNRVKANQARGRKTMPKNWMFAQNNFFSRVVLITSKRNPISQINAQDIKIANTIEINDLDLLRAVITRKKVRMPEKINNKTTILYIKTS